MNKYTNWNLACCYKHANNPKLEKNSIHEYSCFETEQEQKVIKISSRPLVREYIYLNIIELEIIGRVSASFIISNHHLWKFMILQGYEINYFTLCDYLKELCVKGILEKIIVQREFGKILFCYRLGEFGKYIAQAIGAPVRRIDDEQRIMKNTDLETTIMSSIMFNQIIINQLMYNSNCNYFDFYMIKKQHATNRFYIPLLLQTKKNFYFFIYLEDSEHNYEEVKKIIKRWSCFKEMFNNKIFLVLILRNNEYYNIVRKAILTNYDDNFKIGCTTADTWFMNHSGTIQTWILFQGVVVPININEL